MVERCPSFVMIEFCLAEVLLVGDTASCMVPEIDGAYFSDRQKEALWDRFFTGAPARQRQCVERYNIVKRA